MNMPVDLLSLFLHFLTLSLLSIGGAITTAPSRASRWRKGIGNAGSSHTHAGKPSIVTSTTMRSLAGISAAKPGRSESSRAKRRKARRNMRLRFRSG